MQVTRTLSLAEITASLVSRTLLDSAPFEVVTSWCHMLPLLRGPVCLRPAHALALIYLARRCSTFASLVSFQFRHMPM